MSCGALSQQQKTCLPFSKLTWRSRWREFSAATFNNPWMFINRVSKEDKPAGVVPAATWPSGAPRIEAEYCKVPKHNFKMADLANAPEQLVQPVVYLPAWWRQDYCQPSSCWTRSRFHPSPPLQDKHRIKWLILTTPVRWRTLFKCCTRRSTLSQWETLALLPNELVQCSHIISYSTQLNSLWK